MNGYSRIPVKILREDVISGIEFEVDTEGLDCIIKPVDTDIWLYTQSGKPTNRFVVKAGESFEFCGKLYFNASLSGSINYFMYQRL